MATFLYSSASESAHVAAIEKRLRFALPNLTRIAEIDDFARRRPDSSETDYLLVAGVDGAVLSRLVDFATLHRDNGFIVLIGEEISASDYKRLLRTGAADWVAADAVPHDLFEIMKRREGAMRPDYPMPIVASFVPCAGGVGNTTLAVETATLLKTAKAGTKRDICLVDLDFQNSHVCDYLDIEPRLKIQEVSSNPTRLDHQLLDIYVSRHVCGLHVFAAPRSKLDICELNVSALEALFNQISLRYDFVIIDLPVTWFSWTRQIIAGSDGVVLTGLNTVPGLRQLADTGAAIRDAKNDSAAVAVVLNRCERGFFGHIARQHHFKKILARETVFVVRNESLLVESANTGVPLSISGGARKTRNEIAAIAQFCDELVSRRAAASAPADARFDGRRDYGSIDGSKRNSILRDRQS